MDPHEQSNDSGISDEEDSVNGHGASASPSKANRFARAATVQLDHGARRVTVRALAFACDGDLLVSGDGDGRVRVWNSNSAQLHYTQHKHEAAITSVTSAVGGDARDLAASCGADAKVHVWEVRSNLSLFFLSTHTATVWRSVFAPRGAVQLATCSADHSARVWETRSGRPTCILKGHQAGVVGVAWSPDGSRNIATCSWDRTARVWNGLTGKCLHVLSAHHDWVTAVAYSGDGTALATCSNDCTVRVWSPLSGKQVLVLQDHTSDVNMIVFNNSLLASASRDRTVRLLDLQKQAALVTLTGHKDNVPYIGFVPVTVATQQRTPSYATSSHDAILVSCCDDGSIRLWDTRTADTIEQLTGLEEPVVAWDATQGCRVVAAASRDGRVCMWNRAADGSKQRCVIV